MEERQTIYNVSIVLSPADERGMCVSFVSEEQARICAAEAKRDGAFSVWVWTN